MPDQVDPSSVLHKFRNRGRTHARPAGVISALVEATSGTGGDKSGAEESTDGIEVGVSRYWQCTRLLIGFVLEFDNLSKIYFDTIILHVLVLVCARRAIKGK